MDWKKEFYKEFYWLNSVEGDNIVAFIQTLLEDLAKEMIGEEKPDYGVYHDTYDKGHCAGENAKRKDLISIASKWKLNIK